MLSGTSAVQLPVTDGRQHLLPLQPLSLLEMPYCRKNKVNIGHTIWGQHLDICLVCKHSWTVLLYFIFIHVPPNCLKPDAHFLLVWRRNWRLDQMPPPFFFTLSVVTRGILFLKMMNSNKRAKLSELRSCPDNIWAHETSPDPFRCGRHWLGWTLLHPSVFTDHLREESFLSGRFHLCMFSHPN